MAIENLLPPAAGPSRGKIMTVWPSIGSMAPGRWVGALAGNRLGVGFFTLGKVFALVTIPVSLAVYFWRLMPGICRRYTLFADRLMIERGLTAKPGRSIALDQFDEIEIVVLVGQTWLHAGDMVFRQEGKEVFRLSGVVRPEVFRQVCLKARMALLRGREICRQQMAAATSG